MAEWSCEQRSPVQVPEGEAWALVGEQFGRIATWASPITASFLDRQPGKGEVRTCHVGRFGPVPPRVIRERLLSYDPDTRSFSYEADGLPWYVTRAVKRWSVRPAIGGGCAFRGPPPAPRRRRLRALCPPPPVRGWPRPGAGLDPADPPP